MRQGIQQIRQGDVLLTRIEEPAEREIATGPDGLPLAGVRVEGERTGHAHVLLGEVYDLPRERRVVRLSRPTAITHEEHQHRIVPVGWWEVRTQREWIPRPRERPSKWRRWLPRWD